MTGPRQAPLLIVSGTGTAIGKTTVAMCLITAWAQAGRVVAGLKPIETGGDADVAALGRVSTFHVTRFTSPYLLNDAVSPHLAARRERRHIDLQHVARWVSEIRAQVEGVVLELPGG